MGISFGSNSAQSILNFDYSHHQSHFHFVESSFWFIQVVFFFFESGFGLGSFFIVHVESPVICSPFSFHT